MLGWSKKNVLQDEGQHFVYLLRAMYTSRNTNGFDILKEAYLKCIPDIPISSLTLDSIKVRGLDL